MEQTDFWKIGQKGLKIDLNIAKWIQKQPKMNLFVTNVGKNSPIKKALKLTDCFSVKPEILQ